MAENQTIPEHRDQLVSYDELRKIKTARMVHMIGFYAALSLWGMMSLLLPKPTRSEVEKRALATMPEYSKSALLEGSYTKDLELFYADTFPFRDRFVSFAAGLEELRGIRYDGVRIHNDAPKPEQPPMAKVSSRNQAQVSQPEASRAKHSLAPEPQSASTVVDDGAIGERNGAVFVYKNMAMSIFGGSDAMAQWYAETIRTYQDAWGDSVQVYDVVIPTAIEFYLPERYKAVSSPQLPNIQEVYNHLGSKAIGVDAYSSLQAHTDEYLYFNSDHHWTALGAYYAYSAFADRAGIAPLALTQYEKRTISDFSGTMYAQTNDAKLGEDTVDYYLMPVGSTAVRYDKGEPLTPKPHSVWAEYATGVNSYSVFLSGDFPLVKISTDNHNGKKILVVKESFGNAFAPFLIPHYEEVYVVDQRYFELGLVNFVRQNGIGAVIFINNIFAANTGYHIKKLEGMQF